MKSMPSYSLGRTLWLVGSLLLTAPTLVAQGAATEEVTAEAKPTTQEIFPELMRSFLLLQEQMHATQMAVERSRIQAEAAAERNAAALTARLNLLEEALDQAQQNSNAAVEEAGRQIQTSNKTIMLFAGVFATLGFMALALTGYLQWKTLTRLNSPPSTFGFPALLPPQGQGALPLAGSASARGANQQLMEALGRMEHRIAELEGGHPELTHPQSTHQATTPTTRETAGGELGSLIQEGEELLSHEEAEKAIEHFNAVLAKHPGHPEVLLRKGAALERLQRDQEALECYDAAIRADKSLTMAYLHKGGLYNRMEKFSEAMECYEQALRVQEGRTAIN